MSPERKLARVLVRFNHIASFVVNANHGVMRPAEKFCIADCIADCISLGIPQATVAIEMLKKLSRTKSLNRSEPLSRSLDPLRASNAFLACFSCGGDAVQVNI